MRKSTLRLSLILSLLLHFVFGGLLWIKPFHFETRQRPKTIEVEIVDAKELLKEALQKAENDAKGQIVEQQEQALNDEKDEKSKFLSRHNQKVERETKAALNDKFRNTNSTSPQENPHTKPGQNAPQPKSLTRPDDAQKISNDLSKDVKNEEQKKFVTNENGLKSLPSLSDLKPSFKPRMEEPGEAGGEGLSASDDHLKDVATGMQTLLSTREFVYYTYYNRIKDRLRQYWEPKIKEKMERIMRQGRSIASIDRVTKIIITLDKGGLLVKVQVVGASGVEDLDQAAVEAFRSAAPFPNPPKGIIEDDGKIRIRWDFILEAKTDNVNFTEQVARAEYD